MKKPGLLLIAALLFLSGLNFAQTSEDKLGLGAGFGYPYLGSANIDAAGSNYGGYLSLQRNIMDNVDLRFKAGFSHLEGEYTDFYSNFHTSKTNVFFGNLDFIYYPLTFKILSPYLVGGVGAVYRSLKNNATVTLDKNNLLAQFNLGAGTGIKLNSQLKFVIEFNYHLTTNSDLDGALGIDEVNAKDSYISINAGIVLEL